MTTWIGFLTVGEEAPEPHDVGGVGVVHDIVLAGKGKALRAFEVPSDGVAALTAAIPDATPMPCVLNRHQPSEDTRESMWSGLIYPLKAGSEDIVAKIFADSGRPDHDVKDDDGNVVGRLLRTLVFVGPEIAIRVIEVDGDLRTVSRHMSRQPQVRAFEREIEQHLAVPRDMVTPEGAEKFFRDAGMRATRVVSSEL